LVIDDEIDICIMLKLVLEQNGFLVNYYSNPIIGLDELKSKQKIKHIIVSYENFEILRKFGFANDTMNDVITKY
jgi:DNA-binding response OmpR family regulator